MYFRKFLLVFIISLSFESQASTNIAFVNIDFLFENSDIGKSIKNKLKDINQQKSKKFKEIEKNLVQAENEIKKVQNIILVQLQNIGKVINLQISIKIY